MLLFLLLLLLVVVVVCVLRGARAQKTLLARLARSLAAVPGHLQAAWRPDADRTTQRSQYHVVVNHRAVLVCYLSNIF